MDAPTLNAIRAKLVEAHTILKEAEQLDDGVVTRGDMLDVADDIWGLVRTTDMRLDAVNQSD